MDKERKLSIYDYRAIADSLTSEGNDSSEESNVNEKENTMNTKRSVKMNSKISTSHTKSSIRNYYTEAYHEENDEFAILVELVEVVNYNPDGSTFVINEYYEGTLFTLDEDGEEVDEIFAVSLDSLEDCLERLYSLV